MVRCVSCKALRYWPEQSVAAPPAATGVRISVEIPAELHPETAKLVQMFAAALADKLHTAEKKYGYTDGWRTDDWEAECRARLLEHLQKGDPRDVAIYAAFMWARGWSTAFPAATAPHSDALTEIENLVEATLTRGDLQYGLGQIADVARRARMGEDER